MKKNFKDLSRTIPKCKHGHTEEAHPNCFKCPVCGQKRKINYADTKLQRKEGGE